MSRPLRVGVVGVPGAWSTERLAEALARAGAESSVVDLGVCALRLPGSAVYSGGRALALDAAVVKKIGDTAEGWSVRERIQMLRHLEAGGVPVWSSPDRLEAALDRYRMTIELAAAGIPVPETVITEDLEEAVVAVERFESAVLKPLFTSKGRGMQRLDPALDVRRLLTTHAREHPGPSICSAS